MSGCIQQVIKKGMWKCDAGVESMAQVASLVLSHGDDLPADDHVEVRHNVTDRHQLDLSKHKEQV